MLRVRIVCPHERTSAVLDTLTPDPGVVSVTVHRDASVKPVGDVVIADLIRATANETLERVCGLGVEHDGELTIVELDADRSDLADAARDAQPGRGVDAVVWEEFDQRVRADGAPSLAFFCFMAVAALIATVAIVVDSSVLIVGAMVVGPEYGPLAALAVAIYRRQRRPGLDAAATLVGGLVLAILIAALATLVFDATDTGIVSVGARFFTRFVTEPNIYSAVVAFSAGLVGIMAIGLGRSGALTGVVVSATTIPAAAAIGVDAAEGAWRSAGSGAVVLAINVVCLTAGSVTALLAHRILWSHVASIPVGLRGHDEPRAP